MKAHHAALSIHERNSCKGFYTYNNQNFNNRVMMWKRFYYNNPSYLEQSVHSVSKMTLNDICSIAEVNEEGHSCPSDEKWINDWKDIIEGRYASCHLPAGLPETEFRGFHNLFLKFAFYHLKELVSRYDIIAGRTMLYTRLLKDIQDQLLGMSTKTLILELNVMRETQTLKGKNSAERYRYFDDVSASSQAYLNTFFDEYSLLIRLMLEKIDKWLAFTEEIAAHVTCDFKNLLDVFPELKSDDKVKLIETGLGDTHKKGKSVTILSFDGGVRLVYKPRSLEADKNFYNVIEWLNNTAGAIPDLYIPRIVLCDTYGWTEFIPYEACNTEEDVAYFYRSMGAQLALMYVLNATDFHYGNIIAKGAHPVIIDLESLFHQNIQEPEFSEDALAQADKILTGSIMATGILPNMLYQRDNIDQKGIDLSGLAGKGEQKLPFEVSKISSSGTDRMHIQKSAAYLESGQNLPSLGGNYVELTDYLIEIKAGFISCYDHIASNKTTFASLIDTFENTDVRTIIRPTASYGELLRSMYHPDLLRDGLDRDIFLHRLWLQSLQLPKLERLIPFEKDDLHGGDVPIFTTRPGSPHVWCSGGTVIENVFNESALDKVRLKLESLGERDLDIQIHILHMSMLAANASERADVEPVSPSFPVQSAPEKSEFLFRAEEIGDYLLETAISGTTNGIKDITWISTVLEGSKEVIWRIAPVGLDFYNGNSGIALFLGYLGYYTGDKRFTKGAEEALVPILEDMKTYSQNGQYSLGAYSGVGGGFYTLARLASVSENRFFERHLIDALPSFQELIKADTIYDYIGGAASALDIFLSIYKQFGTEEALKAAEKCANHLITHAILAPEGGIAWKSSNHDVPLTGYSHGTGGIAAALSSLYTFTKNGTLVSAIEKALEFERRFYDSHTRNWTTPGRDEISVAWCHGAPGILLSRLRLIENGWMDTHIEWEVEEALATTLRFGFGNNRSYCHGDFGQLEILLKAQKVLKHKDLSAEINAVQSQLLALMKDQQWIRGVSRGTESKGLMVGLAGFGFGLLKQSDPEGVPNILSLD
ncbi:type 2 lanthipeptide synthetase LanM family protein [Salipaludibacillus daqingensis]|uniref:type 2 lanthipeptide synthetase LanM family protein n=1 Tax=Salipaludibacillus daqingensis TaxID=3041001 RepID=UPI0024734A38|nr:type 2 lanthipeptide synthetase LanM family protein [Salipaludibacillus daqingensis]